MQCRGRQLSRCNNECRDGAVPPACRSGEIDSAGFAAIAAPGQRRDRSIARFLGQNLGAGPDPGQEDKPVVVPRGDDVDAGVAGNDIRSEEHTSELQSRRDLVCRLLLEKKKKKKKRHNAEKKKKKKTKNKKQKNTK